MKEVGILGAATQPLPLLSRIAESHFVPKNGGVHRPPLHQQSHQTSSQAKVHSERSTQPGRQQQQPRRSPCRVNAADNGQRSKQTNKRCKQQLEQSDQNTDSCLDDHIETQDQDVLTPSDDAERNSFQLARLPIAIKGRESTPGLNVHQNVRESPSGCTTKVEPITPDLSLSPGAADRDFHSQSPIPQHPSMTAMDIRLRVVERLFGVGQYNVLRPNGHLLDTRHESALTRALWRQTCDSGSHLAALEDLIQKCQSQLSATGDRTQEIHCTLEQLQERLDELPEGIDQSLSNMQKAVTQLSKSIRDLESQQRPPLSGESVARLIKQAQDMAQSDRKVDEAFEALAARRDILTQELDAALSIRPILDGWQHSSLQGSTAVTLSTSAESSNPIPPHLLTFWPSASAQQDGSGRANHGQKEGPSIAAENHNTYERVSEKTQRFPSQTSSHLDDSEIVSPRSSFFSRTDSFSVATANTTLEPVTPPGKRHCNGVDEMIGPGTSSKRFKVLEESLPQRSHEPVSIQDRQEEEDEVEICCGRSDSVCDEAHEDGLPEASATSAAEKEDSRWVKTMSSGTNNDAAPPLWDRIQMQFRSSLTQNSASSVPAGSGHSGSSLTHQDAAAKADGSTEMQFGRYRVASPVESPSEPLASRLQQPISSRNVPLQGQSSSYAWNQRHGEGIETTSCDQQKLLKRIQDRGTRSLDSRLDLPPPPWRRPPSRGRSSRPCSSHSRSSQSDREYESLPWRQSEARPDSVFEPRAAKDALLSEVPQAMSEELTSLVSQHGWSTPRPLLVQMFDKFNYTWPKGIAVYRAWARVAEKQSCGPQRV